MSIFSKIKQNINHGGVQIAIEAPDSASITDNITAKITLTASEPATVKKMSLDVVSESRGHSHVGNDSVNNDSFTVIAHSESPEVFNLNAGETKVIEMSVQMPAAQLQNVDGALGNIAQGLAGIASAAMNVGHYYYLQANANVEGIALDPSVRKTINISSAPNTIQD